MAEELNMMVSPVCVKDGEKFAYVTFSDEARVAEGKIPDCKIVSNKGFTDDEVKQLEKYLQLELINLKRMAAAIRPIDAIMKED